jgi:hypothetical protein
LDDSWLFTQLGKSQEQAVNNAVREVVVEAAKPEPVAEVQREQQMAPPVRRRIPLKYTIRRGQLIINTGENGLEKISRPIYANEEENKSEEEEGGCDNLIKEFVDSAEAYLSQPPSRQVYSLERPSLVKQVKFEPSIPRSPDKLR